jgi:phosphate-selective porin OprO and OprP
MRLLLSLLLLCALPVVADGQTPAPAANPAAPSQGKPAAKAPNPYDKIWGSFTEWYRDDSNPVVQRVLLSGRFHYDYARINSDQGDNDEWNIRRLRIGPRITLFKTLTFHGEVELDPQRHDPFYVRFTDLYVQWVKSPRLSLTVGKQGAPFTLDGATSSRELLTIDRSNLANNIWSPQEYLPGVSVAGRRALWVYRVGLYSAGEMNRELGEFNGGIVTLGVLGYDFAARLKAKEALLTGNYVYQHPDRVNTFTRQLEHIGSLNFRFERAKWGARADLSTASGYLGQSDLWALQAMPFFNVTEKFQVVGRYTFIDSEAPNGVRLTTYESRVVPGRGDEYSELYLGANYYFYGHRLKLQTGLQFADMNDRANDGGEYSGVAWTTGLRVGW